MAQLVQNDDTGRKDAAQSRASVRRKRRENVGGGRPRQIQVKLTDQEEQLLRMRAAAERVSVQRLLLACTLDPEWRADDEETAAPRTSRRDEAIAALASAGELRNLLAAIGNNINQIAAHVNATEELAEDVVPALDAARRACDAVTARMRAVAVPRGAAAR